MNFKLVKMHFGLLSIVYILFICEQSGAAMACLDVFDPSGRVAAYEAIRSRHILMGDDRSAVLGARQVNAAYEAWNRGGRPLITKEVLRDIIDPHLNPGFVEPKKNATWSEILIDSFVLERLGLIGDIHLFEKMERLHSLLGEPNPEVMSNAAALEVIESRWQVLAKEHALTTQLDNQDQIYAALTAWKSAGRPRMVPSVLHSVIDPQLTSLGAD